MKMDEVVLLVSNALHASDRVGKFYSIHKISQFEEIQPPENVTEFRATRSQIVAAVKNLLDAGEIERRGGAKMGEFYRYGVPGGVKKWSNV